MKEISCVIVFLIICGCQGDFSGTTEAETAWLYKADPLEELKEAIKLNDYRFIGIYRYSLTVPGVPLKCIDLETDVRPIKGTSDAFSSYEEEKFNAIATVYADYYSFQLKKIWNKTQALVVKRMKSNNLNLHKRHRLLEMLR